MGDGSGFNERDQINGGTLDSSSTGEKSMSAYRVGFIVMLTLVSIAFVAVVWPFFPQSYGLWFSRLSFFRSMLALNVP